MLDREEHDRWLEAAGSARTAARVQAEAAMYNWACFLAEQAAQLAVKALLHGVGAGAWGHDLVALGARVREAVDTEIPDQVNAALRRLSRHYIPPRYPDAHPGGSPMGHYGSDDADEATGDADRITAFVEDLWTKLLDAEREQESGGAEAGDDGG